MECEFNRVCISKYFYQMYIILYQVDNNNKGGSLFYSMRSKPKCTWCSGGGGWEFKFGSPFSSAHSFVFSVPMVLLAFNSTICCIPTTPINGLCFAIKTLKNLKNII